MTTPFERAYRRLRFGRAVIVVSGLPRSGTSMAMKMLEAGGIELLTDGIRTADESNPKGYFELERVKELDKRGDASWLQDAKGKAVKIISFLLVHLPETANYKVIFMHRDLGEVLASQKKMLAERGEAAETGDDRMVQLYEEHLKKVKRLTASRSCFDVIDVVYNDVLSDAPAEVARISTFLGGGLDTGRMAAAVDQELYRNRKT